ncbi:hypothetical protein RND81_01G041900 [Saponaria officinalis]|uniref:Uncharacterized protein n=1 Tax=Saponaria officinalis TaxID=3572 RepID=A0AAW1NBG8_SAPOF
MKATADLSSTLMNAWLVSLFHSFSPVFPFRQDLVMNITEYHFTLAYFKMGGGSNFFSFKYIHIFFHLLRLRRETQGMEEATEVRLGNVDRWSLHGMTALVTGGTKGIGHEVVEELTRLGARVYTCARSEADVESCLQNWKTKGFQVDGSLCDVASREQRD